MVQIFVKVLSLDNLLELFLYTDNKKEDVQIAHPLIGLIII